MHHKYDVSLILPCYQEAEIFEESLNKILTILDATNFTYEIICIDDASVDGTPELIKKALKQYQKSHNLSAYYHQKNRGRGATVRHGIENAKGKVVGYIDIDLEVPAWYLPRFIKAVQDSADVAIAHRIFDLNRRNILRWLSSKGYTFLRQMFLGLPYKDTEAGYKFFKGSVAQQLAKVSHHPHWFWDTELLLKAREHNYSVVELPVVFIRRTDKTSTVKLIPDTINYIKALIQYKKST